MNELGALSLRLAFLVSLYAFGAALWGAYRRRRSFVLSARSATYASCALVSVATFVLWRALVVRDFSLLYVAEYSSRDLPTGYAITALWGGQTGSLLLWAWILALCAALAQWQNRERNRELMPYVTAVTQATLNFFLFLLIFVTDPFERVPRMVQDGAGLNPLLQNPWMAIHPPSLYLGFVTVTIPFAFAVAALATGRLGDAWIRTTRRWTLAAWFFLTIGNLLGAQWAYLELGWGGYWAWDPVENAALMPWLTMTAFLHSVIIQEKKDMLRVWNMVLIVLSFLLTIFGTFLTRSGVISSVHSFTKSGLGPYFIVFMLTTLAASALLISYRLPQLRSDNELDSFLSREATFLFNNLLLLGITFATLWGTIFPIISEAVRGTKITVGPPFFNKVNTPLGLALLFLTGVGPVIAWRRATARNLTRQFALPFLLGTAAGITVFAAGYHHFYACVAVAFSVFVFTTIIDEFRRGTQARRALVHEGIGQALGRLVAKNRRRYGGYIVHAGVVFAMIGIAASSAFRTEAQVTVDKGESFRAGSFDFTYENAREVSKPHYAAVIADISVKKNGKHFATMHPEKRIYRRQQQPTSEVALKISPWEDLYVVLGGIEGREAKQATILVYVNPLVSWIWLGGLVMVAGTIVAVWPSAAEKRSLAFSREEVSVEAWLD